MLRLCCNAASLMLAQCTALCCGHCPILPAWPPNLPNLGAAHAHQVHALFRAWLDLMCASQPYALQLMRPKYKRPPSLHDTSFAFWTSASLLLQLMRTKYIAAEAGLKRSAGPAKQEAQPGEAGGCTLPLAVFADLGLLASACLPSL